MARRRRRRWPRRARLPRGCRPGSAASPRPPSRAERRGGRARNRGREGVRGSLLEEDREGHAQAREGDPGAQALADARKLPEKAAEPAQQRVGGGGGVSGGRRRAAAYAALGLARRAFRARRRVRFAAIGAEAHPSRELRTPGATERRAERNVKTPADGDGARVSPSGPAMRPAIGERRTLELDVGAGAREEEQANGEAPEIKERRHRRASQGSAQRRACGMSSAKRYFEVA